MQQNKTGQADSQPRQPQLQPQRWEDRASLEGWKDVDEREAEGDFPPAVRELANLLNWRGSLRKLVEIMRKYA